MKGGDRSLYNIPLEIDIQEAGVWPFLLRCSKQHLSTNYHDGAQVR